MTEERDTNADLDATGVDWDLETLLVGDGHTSVDDILNDADRVAADLASHKGSIGAMSAQASLNT